MDARTPQIGADVKASHDKTHIPTSWKRAVSKFYEKGNQINQLIAKSCKMGMIFLGSSTLPYEDSGDRTQTAARRSR